MKTGGLCRYPTCPSPTHWFSIETGCSLYTTTSLSTQSCTATQSGQRDRTSLQQKPQVSHNSTPFSGILLRRSEHMNMASHKSGTTLGPARASEAYNQHVTEDTREHTRARGHRGWGAYRFILVGVVVEIECGGHTVPGHPLPAHAPSAGAQHGRHLLVDGRWWGGLPWVQAAAALKAHGRGVPQEERQMAQQLVLAAAHTQGPGTWTRMTWGILHRKQRVQQQQPSSALIMTCS